MGGGKGPGRDMGHSPERERGREGPKLFLWKRPSKSNSEKGEVGENSEGKKKKRFFVRRALTVLNSKQRTEHKSFLTSAQNAFDNF